MKISSYSLPNQYFVYKAVRKKQNIIKDLILVAGVGYVC